MGYTHYFGFTPIKSQAKILEAKYQRALKDCSRIVKKYSAEYGGLQVNGSRDEANEPFELHEHFIENNDDSRGFCKTARKPYDLVVTACLAVLKHRLGNAIQVTSDGYQHDWDAGVQYAC